MLNVLLFIGNYIGCVVLSFASHPAWAFILYEIVYFMNPADRWWGTILPSISYSFYAVLLMMVVYLRGFTELNKSKLLAAPQFKWIFAIGLGYIITGFYAVYPEQHYVATIFFIKLIIIISIAYKIVNTDKMLDGILYAYIFGAWYIGLLTYQVGRNSGDRVEGIGTVDSPDANGIAAAIAPAIVLAIYYYWVSQDKRVRILMVVAGVFIANSIVLINSRASFLATVISLLYLIGHLYFSKFQRPRQKLSVIFLIVFGLAGSAYLVDDSALERFKSIENENTQIIENQEVSRMVFWLSSIDVANDNPFGLGYKGFDFVAPDYLPDAKVGGGANRHRSVHSTWLQALTELGYIGLIVLILMLTSCFRATRCCQKVLIERNDIDNYFKVVALEGALLAYIVAMTFMNRFTSEVLYWLVLYTACAYNIYVVSAPKE